MPTPKQLVMMLIRDNPNIANNPQAQEMLDIIDKNDSKRGEVVAQNLCDTYGVTREQAIAQAERYFHLK